MARKRPVRSAETGKALTRRVEGLAETTLRDCFQCRKCSAGCTVGGVTDMLPHEMVQAVLLGEGDRVFASRFLWLCVGCQTCLTRCPNRVNIPAAIDALRALALASDAEPAEPKVLAFHRAFLDVVRRRGRLHELSMIGRYKFAAGGLFEDLGLGVALWRRGKIPIRGPKPRGRDEVRAMFDRVAAPLGGERPGAPRASAQARGEAVRPPHERVEEK